MKNFFYCLILPHPSNNHRATFLHHKIISLFIFFFVFSSFFFSSSLNPFGGRLGALADISNAELVNITNQVRAENGLAPLSENGLLNSAASSKADDMFAKNYWSHNAPDGTTPWFFIKQAGYSYVYAGENLARGFGSAGDVVNAWMASAEHRANLLSGSYKDVGFSVKSGSLTGEDTLLVVQELGSTSVLGSGNSQTAAPTAVPTFTPTAIPAQLPTSTPTPAPTATLTPTPVAAVVGSNQPPWLNSSVLVKPSFTVSSKMTIAFLTLLMGVLFVDMFFVHRRKITRFVGHNFDHMVFIALIIIVIAVFNTGATL